MRGEWTAGHRVELAAEFKRLTVPPKADTMVAEQQSSLR